MKKYPDLDYYIKQPIVRDYFVGVYKAYHRLKWNEMSVLFEPAARYLPPDIPGEVRNSVLPSIIQCAISP